MCARRVHLAAGACHATATAAKPASVLDAMLHLGDVSTQRECGECLCNIVYAARSFGLSNASVYGRSRRSVYEDDDCDPCHIDCLWRFHSVTYSIEYEYMRDMLCM